MAERSRTSEYGSEPGAGATPNPDPKAGRAAYPWGPALREGLVAGILGAAAVALWFLLMDLIFREAFYTPGALGSLVFLGARGPDGVVISPGTVLGYTVFHVIAFLLLGVVISSIVTGLETNRGLIGAVVIFFAVSAVVFLALVTFLGVWILSEMAIWAVLVGNLLAVATMAVYLGRRHPVLRKELRGEAMWREI